MFPDSSTGLDRCPRLTDFHDKDQIIDRTLQREAAWWQDASYMKVDRGILLMSYDHFAMATWFYYYLLAPPMPSSCSHLNDVVYSSTLVSFSITELCSVSLIPIRGSLLLCYDAATLKDLPAEKSLTVSWSSHRQIVLSSLRIAETHTN